MGGSPSSVACAPSVPRTPGAFVIRAQKPRRHQRQLPLAIFLSSGHKRLSSSSFPKQQPVLSTRATSTGDGLQERGGGRRTPLPPSAVTYTASISTDLPLYEPPWAPFDDYLADRPRVFRAMFPDKRRSQRINEEEWRIRMLPIQFLLLSVDPIVVMRLRCRSTHGNGNSFPSSAPRDVPKVLELQATKWELQGLDRAHMPPHFELDVQGSLYSDRRGGRSRLKGDLKMSISLVLPAIFALVPDEVLRNVAQSVLKRLVERLKQEVDVNLLADYRKFSKEMSQRQQQLPSIKRTV